MIEKVCTFKGGSIDTVFPLLSPYEGMTKTAQLEITEKLHPRIQDFVRAFRPTPHGIYVLVNAMGSSEYWSSNANGDWWPEKGLIHAPPDWDELSPEQMKEVGSRWPYGYPTFMKAHVFTHHQNKDPAKSIGDVVLAVWNPKMHRVELILYLDRSRAMAQGSLHVLERIEQGEFPDVSMGCRVPYDVCTICENPSKTRDDYCIHARKWMNKILPDGRKIAVRNDFPNFFDISVVFIGADKTAKVMAKLAEVGNQVCLGGFCTVKTARQVVRGWPALMTVFDDAEMLKTASCSPSAKCPCERLGTSSCCMQNTEKLAARLFPVSTEKGASQRKVSEIIKEIPAGPFTQRTLPRLETMEQDLPNDVLDQMGGMQLGRSMSTPGMMGIVLKPREFQRIMLIRIGEKPLADDLDHKGRVFAQSDKVDDEIPIDKGHVDDHLVELLRHIGALFGRSIAGPALQRRTRTAHTTTTKQPQPQAAANDDDHPVLKKVAALYNGYRRCLSKKATDIGSYLVSDSRLLVDLYGDSTVQAFAGGVEKTASASALSPESLAYLTGAYYPNRDFHLRSESVVQSLALTGIAAEASA